MAKLLGNFLLLLLLILPTTILFVGQGGRSNLALADNGANDAMEGEDEDTTVETDDGGQAEEGDVVATDKEGEEEEEEDQPLKPSDDADTYILFMNPNVPAGENREVPTGKLIRVLVGFTNKGDKDFTIESMEGSFRYPQDFSFYVHNFTTVSYAQVVEPKKQATFEYGFTANEAFNARPFGLTINLNYRDGDNYFQNAVYNETITVVEPDEGLDGETFFMYIFLAAVAVLLLVGVQQMMASFGRKRLLKPKPVVEMGTQKTDVDYDWLPKETLQEMNRSPRRSPKQSPRQRRSKRSSGSGEE